VANVSFFFSSDKRPFSSFEKGLTPIEPLLDLNRDLYAIVPSPAKQDTIVDDSNGAFLAVNYPEYLESPVIEPMKSKIQELTATLEEAKTKRAADVKHERSQKAKAKDELRSEKSARQSDNHLIQELRIRMDGADRRNEASDRRNEASDRRNEASDRRIEELDRELKDAKEKITALQSAVLYEVGHSNLYFSTSLILYNRTFALCDSFSSVAPWMTSKPTLRTISFRTPKGRLPHSVGETG